MPGPVAAEVRREELVPAALTLRPGLETGMFCVVSVFHRGDVF